MYFFGKVPTTLSRRSLMTRALLFVLIISLGVSACEPLGPVAGRALSGEVVAPPADWSNYDSQDTVQIETAPDSPYSVNIWGVGLGPYYYVAAANGEDTGWAKRIARDDRVRLRIDNKVFELRALRVNDSGERERVGLVFQRKYDIEHSDDFPEVVLFRLVRR